MSGGQPRNLRACMVCSVVLSYAEFLRDGCPNCEDILELATSADNVQECTSQVFEGLITVQNTSSSWVARWQRLEGYQPGIYAVKVVGNLPDDIRGRIIESGKRLIARDGTDEDEQGPDQ